MSELSQQEIEILAQKDLAGQATEDDVDLLYSDCDRWRAYLTHEKRRVEQELGERKAESMRVGGKVALREFTKFKAEQMQYVNLIQGRLGDIKAVLRGENEEINYTLTDTLAALLQEVRSIRQILESARDDADENA